MQYEYLTDSFHHSAWGSFPIYLNNRGADGWKLITAVFETSNNHWHVIFMREKPDSWLAEAQKRTRDVQQETS